MLSDISGLQRSALRSKLLHTGFALCLAAMFLPGCTSDSAVPGGESDAEHAHDDGEAHSHEEETEQQAETSADTMPPGVVPIPPQVRQNLGITFATVEMRRVESTIRVPGRFEPLPSAVREYHAPLAGRVELLVHQYDHVTTGQPLYRLDSSEWRRMQQELLTAEAEVMATSASLMTAQVAREGGEAAGEVIKMRIGASDSHIKTLQQSLKLAEEREKQVVRLQELVGGRLTELNEARTQIATLKNELTQAQEDRAELEHEHLMLATDGTESAYGTTETRAASLVARQAEYESAKARRDLLLASLKSIAANASSTAAINVPGKWKVEPEITVTAVAEGRVSEIPVSNGAYLNPADKILTTVNPHAVRFRAVALQSDILRIGDSMSGRILKPGTQGTGDEESIPVVVTPGLEADPEERTLDVIAEVHGDVPWARAGLSTDLELVLDDSEDPETAIPVAAVIQDGLEKVFFRRNPNNLDQVVRTQADLGMSDGRWVVVYSGVKAGDQVVLDGVYELKLATTGVQQKGGHVHADGTFHEEDH